MDNHSIENLLIVDDNYLSSYTKYYSVAQNAQTLLNEFFTTVQDIKLERVMEGKTADNLFEFTQMATQALGSQLDMLMSSYTADMPNYIAEIDEADNILYGED